MNLNLGAGRDELHLPGYENWDRKNGREAYPLDVPDSSCWTIRASHVLEHFSHRDVPSVIDNWVSKLAPGGCLKVAVPNFDLVATEHLTQKGNGHAEFIMGSHVDEDDRHGCLFDRASLFTLMRANKLARIGPWESEINDCASHRYSLNLQGFKPTLADVETIPDGAVVAVEASPRFAPVAHSYQALKSFTLLRIQCEVSQGCFWHQQLSEGMERALETNCKYVLTLDYDTIFQTSDVLELYRLMEAFPEADAITSVQSKRHSNCILAVGLAADGSRPDLATLADRLMTRIATAHFGLTIFRASSLRKLPRPWMMPEANGEGRWGDGHIDADMSFWYRWNEAGHTLFLANRVVVGHMSETIEWPGPDHRTIYQPLREYEKEGIPAGVQR